MNVFFMWNGSQGRIANSEYERDELAGQGYIQVPGFEADRVLPTADEVQKQLTAADTGEYATKDMKPRRTRQRKADEAGDEAA